MSDSPNTGHLIAFAGFPGTGKSTLAWRLAEVLPGVVLDKDRVRPTLFPPPVLDYSRAEDDLVMQAIYAATRYLRRQFPHYSVILDGRTYARAYQVSDLLALADSLNQPLRLIECVCDDARVRERLERDTTHPAQNRTFAHYLASRAAAVPIQVPRLILDTGQTSPERCLADILAYLAPVPKHPPS